MGWKTIHGRSYYYRLERQGDRVVSEYVGTEDMYGDIAAILEKNAATKKRREKARRLEFQAARDEAEAIENPMRAWCRQVEAIARAALVAAGYYQHRRGEWRKRGGQSRAARHETQTFAR